MILNAWFPREEDVLRGGFLAEFGDEQKLRRVVELRYKPMNSRGLINTEDAITVNWSACGSQSPETFRAFMQVCEEVQTLVALLEKFPPLAMEFVIMQVQANYPERYAHLSVQLAALRKTSE